MEDMETMKAKIMDAKKILQECLDAIGTDDTPEEDDEPSDMEGM